MDENRIRQIFQEEIARAIGADHFVFRKHLELGDGRNIQTGRTTGTKIGTATDQKIGFFGHVPVIQQTAPTDAASIIVLLKAYGLSA